MITVTTFNGVDVRARCGTRLGSLLNQPRRLAVFLYLLTEGTGGRRVARDTLLGVFWPDMSPDKASHNLSQSLTYIRRSLGDDVIEGRGTSDIWILTERVKYDVTDFRSCVRQGEHMSALRLYTGPFLRGFVVDGAEEFEKWEQSQRAALQSAAASSAHAAAIQCLSDGLLVDGVTWARKAVEFTHGDENAVRDLMLLLERLGDRSSVLDAYDSLAARLAHTHNVVPSVATEEIALRVRQSVANDRDVRAVDPVRTLGESDTPPEPSRVESRPGRVLKGARRFGIAAASGLLAISLAAVWGLRRNPVEAGSPPLPIVGVENVQSATTSGEGFATQLTSELLTQIELDGRPSTLPVSGLKREEHSGNGYILRVTISPDSGLRQVAHALLINATTGSLVYHIKVSSSSDPAVLAHTLGVSVRKAIGDYSLQLSVLARANNVTTREMLSDIFRDRQMADSLQQRGAARAADAHLLAADSLLRYVISNDAGISADAIRLLARTAYDRMWLYLVPPLADLRYARKVMALGKDIATRSVTADPRSAEALERLGAFNYWQALTAAPDSQAVALVQLLDAEKYLRRATLLSGHTGYAWSLLSAIEFSRGNFQQAYITAEKARAEDPFEGHSADILFRLFNSSIEVGDTVATNNLCDEIRVTLGDGFEHAYCSLVSIASTNGKRDVEPAVESALRKVSPSHNRYGELQLLAGVIEASHGMRSKALHRALAAKACIQDNAECLQAYAWLQTELGDKVGAEASLNKYVSKLPFGGIGIRRERRFAGLSRS